ncbi:MAG TPA: glycosyltransferase [Candidatus Eisenbacteria bacterium]|nr:glycosyltransferase [Candidatus Eisenbacteria bacterium]
MPSVSILLPTRDRPEFLLEALECVRRQTHPELELILVRDGGAPLGEAVIAVIDRLEFPTTLVEHDGDPEGAARARNRGLERARGDAVAFLDDDDLWEPAHTAALARAFDGDPDADVVYSDAVILNVATDGTRTIAREFDPGVFVRDGFIPPSAMAVRRAAFERFGVFDESFLYSEDWEWLIRVARGGGKIRRVPGVTATIRIHAGGVSALDGPLLDARRRSLERLAERYALPPIEPKTFWEVAAAV